jgi:hypothetical protein
MMDKSSGLRLQSAITRSCFLVSDSSVCALHCPLLEDRVVRGVVLLFELSAEHAAVALNHEHEVDVLGVRHGVCSFQTNRRPFPAAVLRIGCTICRRALEA